MKIKELKCSFTKYPSAQCQNKESMNLTQGDTIKVTVNDKLLTLFLKTKKYSTPIFHQ